MKTQKNIMVVSTIIMIGNAVYANPQITNMTDEMVHIKIGREEASDRKGMPAADRDISLIKRIPHTLQADNERSGRINKIYVRKYNEKYSKIFFPVTAETQKYLDRAEFEVVDQTDPLKKEQGILLEIIDVTPEVVKKAVSGASEGDTKVHVDSGSEGDKKEVRAEATASSGSTCH